MKKLMLLLLLSLSFVVSSVMAQTEISPEKQKAIKELILLVNAGNRSEEIAKTMMTQMSSVRNITIQSIIDERGDLSPSDKKELEKTLIADSDKFAQRFQTKLFERVNYSEVMSEIMTVVYDKYYSLEEINALTAFYKTPTGQKSLKVMQPLMADTMKLSQEKFLPILLPIVQESIEEERQELRKRANDSKPRKQTSN